MILAATICTLATVRPCSEDSRKLLCNEDGTYKARQFRQSRKDLPYCFKPDTGAADSENCFTKCDTQKKSLSLRGSKGLQCDAEGLFKEYQCYKTNECWCVEPIEGKRQAWDICPGMKFVTCSKNYRHIFTSRPAAMLPTCDDEDNFTPRQCDEEGNCFCVDTTTGLKLTDTSCIAKPCETAASETPETAPLCTEDGFFFSKQCSYKDGILDTTNCYCVDTQTGIQTDSTSCLETSCQQELAAVDADSFYTPVCKSNGLYERKQCRSEHDCWCVFQDTGLPHFSSDCLFTKCENERRHANRIGANPPTCLEGKYIEKQCVRQGRRNVCHCVDPDTNEKTNNTRCLRSYCEIQRDTAIEQPDTHDYIPTCNLQGEYTYKQCDKTDTCWCSSSLGKPLTDRDCLLSKCEYSVKTAANRPGSFVPKCDKDGNYETKQCHADVKLCWCVDSEGSESEDQSCIQTACEKQRDKLMKNPASWSPHCTPEGDYNHKQCRSTGDCWCVNVVSGEKDLSDKSCFINEDEL